MLQYKSFKHVDFCLQSSSQQEINSDDDQKSPLRVKYQEMIMFKRFSIKTASSIKDEEEDQEKKQAKFTQEDLKFTNVQLLERENSCKISQEGGIYPSCFALISIPKRKQNVTLDQLKQFNFSVLSYSVRDLVNFSTEMIYSNEYAQQIFQKSQMEELILLIACNYNKVSYHNFSHAFSLMQLNFQCVEHMPQFKQKFTPEELFYTFISGISHDLNHRGTNNTFQVKRKTDLALMYNKESVLQNMHISTLWKILRENPAQDFLDFADNHKNAKQMITKLILSTDMNYHFRNLQLLQKRRQQNEIDMNKSEDRMFMMQQVFHSCDLGNPTLQYNSYLSWAALLSHQFNEQTKLQNLYEVQVTKSFQYKSLSTLYNDQVWFVGKIVYPLWRQLSLHLPGLDVLKRRIQENAERLKEILAEEQLKART